MNFSATHQVISCQVLMVHNDGSPGKTYSPSLSVSDTKNMGAICPV